MFTFISLQNHTRHHMKLLRTQRELTVYPDELLLALETLNEAPVLYDHLCNTRNTFFIHFAATITHEIIPEKEAFVLLEDLLIFIREKTLRTPRHKASPTEISLLEWVESGKLWKPTDGTLFSSIFFYDLPLVVLQGVMEQSTLP